MPERLARLARNTLQWRSFALPVLGLLALSIVVLYRRAFAVGVLSDGWVLLEIGSRGFRQAPFVLLSYHTIPVTNLLMAALWKTFGLAERWYQIANLAELAVVGWLLYLLGCSLFRQARIGLLASLLFVANSSFYEVPFWPTVGNFQSLAAILYLAAVLAVHRAFRSSRRWPWIFLFSLCGVAAFFTYEPAVSVLAVGPLYPLLQAPPDGEAPTWKERWQRMLAVLAPSLPAFAVVLGSKLVTALHGYQAMFAPTSLADLRVRIYLLVRGCVAIFSLLGADNKIYQLLTFRLVPPFESPLLNALLVVWLLLLTTAFGLLLWKSGCGAVRFVAIWFAIHMVSVAAATQLVSRHFYLGALPASLLMSWLIWRAADALASWVSRGDARRQWAMPEPQTAAVVAFFTLTLLAANAKADLDTAGAVYKEATQASRQVVALVQQRLAAAPSSLSRIALVNMPASLSQNGVSAFAFINGLHPLLQLSTQGRVTQPELLYTYTYARSPAESGVANASLPVTLAELTKRINDPASLVLMFDRRTRTVLELNRTTWQVPERYDFASSPFLEWQPGAWPWFRLFPGQPLELPLATAAPSPWVGLKYFHAPASSFLVVAGSQLGYEVRPQPVATPHWPAATFPLPHPDDGPVSVNIVAESELWLAGVWTFSPPAAYAPEVAPFLSWNLLSGPAFSVEEPLDLPLAPPACPQGGCPIRLEYLAEQGRDFSLAVADGPARALGFSGVKTPEWRDIELAAAPGELAVVRIRPSGTSPVLIHRLAWTPPS